MQFDSEIVLRERVNIAHHLPQQLGEFRTARGRERGGDIGELFRKMLDNFTFGGCGGARRLHGVQVGDCEHEVPALPERAHNALLCPTGER